MTRPIGYYTDTEKRVRPVTRSGGLKGANRTSRYRAKVDDPFETAVKEFGVTYDFREAGYILPDGRLLDLSGKTEGGDPFQRSLDHREISRVIQVRDNRTGTKAMDAFERMGAIRFGMTGDPKRGYQINISLNTYQNPSTSQIIKMKQSVMVARRFGPTDLFYDIFDDHGDRAISIDDGSIQNASQRHIDEMLGKLAVAKARQ